MKTLFLAAMAVVMTVPGTAAAQTAGRGSNGWNNNCNPPSTPIGGTIMESQKTLTIGSRSYPTTVSIFVTVSGAALFVSLTGTSADKNNVALVIYNNPTGNFAPFKKMANSDKYRARVQLDSRRSIDEFTEIAILDPQNRPIGRTPFNLRNVLQGWADQCADD